MLLYEVSVSNLFSLPTLHFNNMAHIRFLSTLVKGTVTFKEDNSPLQEYLLKRKENIDGSEFTLKSIAQVIHDEIKAKRMFDPENPGFILCDQELATALGVKAFRVGNIERIILPQLDHEDPHPLDIQEEKVLVTWPIGGGRIPKMATHGLNILQVGDLYESKYPSFSDKRSLKPSFLGLINAITPEGHHKVPERKAMDFQSIFISVNHHLKDAPHAELFIGEGTRYDNLIHDVSNSPVGRYFGTKVLSNNQLKGLLLFEWADLTAYDIPRCVQITDAEETSCKVLPDLCT